MILKAEIEDIPTLNKISVTSKKHWGYSQELIELWLDDLTITTDYFPKVHIYKLVIESQIVGFCAISENAENYEVDHLWVLPEFIGKGWGKELLNTSLQKSVVKDKSINVVADPFAEAFYVSQGFKTYHKIESIPKGRYLPVMRKEPILI